MDTNKKPIINCHTHIFIGENIPPFIAKTFFIWPLYKIVSIPFVLSSCRWWFLSAKSPRQWKQMLWYKNLQRAFVNYRSFLRRHDVVDILVKLLNLVIVYHALIYFTILVFCIDLEVEEQGNNIVSRAIKWLADNKLFYYNAPAFLKVITILFTCFFIEYARKLIFFIAKKSMGFIKILPEKKTVEFILRYVNIGRFAYYKKQSDIFNKLKAQYPEGTGFVILPMDMEYMDAGILKPDGRYEKQMQQLAEIKSQENRKNIFFPFVFVDPRRQMAGDKIFLDWKDAGNGNVELNDCFIKEYIEDKNFSGFKIYPALGYYPFDEKLLPLWKYAADRQIPILTHAIRGNIYYRGNKKTEWNYHPIFKEAAGNGNTRKLLLPQIKNIDFINNFTHPLNYLCLVEERLLRIFVSTAGDNVKQLFGYTDSSTPLKYNLSHLKLCFGHFGGDDEWPKFFEHDRDNFTSQVITKATGIDFVHANDSDVDIMTRLERIWKDVDWYSIICSMMMKYSNLYADISYILHKDEILPLLKSTLQNIHLNKRVLYGTDFYVVRNHKSEKELLADMMANLSEEDFDMIARENPVTFLNLMDSL